MMEGCCNRIQTNFSTLSDKELIQSFSFYLEGNYEKIDILDYSIVSDYVGISLACGYIHKK